MTEFEKFLSEQTAYEYDPMYKEMLEKTWHAAQRAILRTISEPPYIPKVGDHVKFLSLSKKIGEVAEITDVKKAPFDVYWVGTKRYENDEAIYSSGILSEVEKYE